MRITSFLAAAIAAIAVGAGTSGALAAERPSLADQLAARLGVSRDELRAAFRATLAARVDAAVAAGRLTPAQGARLKRRIANAKGLGLVVGRGLVERRRAFVDRIEKRARGRGAAATYLGLTRETLVAELRKGTSLAQVARERGRSVDGLVAAMVAPAKERLAKAIENERLTRQRADAILRRLTDRVERLVQRTVAAT